MKKEDKVDAKGFAEQLRMSLVKFSPPVRSLVDVDFYKFTMGQLILRYFPDIEVVFKLIIRDAQIPIGMYIDEGGLRQCLDYTAGLQFSTEELYYLKGIDLLAGRPMFIDDYLYSLRGFRLSPYRLAKVGSTIELTFSGRWAEVSMWETIALAIISELYYRAVLSRTPRHALENVYSQAQTRLYGKLERLKGQHDISFADFGQRRRHSFLWQKHAVELCRDILGAQFTGTSNTYLARHHNLPAIGTNAHELPMVLTALANSNEEMRQAQYRVLELWQEMYGQGLRIFLPDTYGSEQFFAGAPEWLKYWRGQRQDSGDPKTEGERYVNWLRERGVDPADRLTIFSDGLDVDPMIEIGSHFEGKHRHAYGWGTLLTNDFAGCDPANPNLRPFSMVCKVVAANGRPCVKLSNNINKATGPAEEIRRYVHIFGSGGRESQSVLV